MKVIHDQFWSENESGQLFEAWLGCANHWLSSIKISGIVMVFNAG